MNRSARRHRSTKVPNVKLRPAPLKGGESVIDQEWEADQEAMRHYRALRVAHASGKQKVEEKVDEEEEEDDNEDEDDEEGEGKDHAPLTGCVICTTGFIEEKVALHECAVALGATVEGNLTESATHLIADKPGSMKYYCAVRLGLPVLKPIWLYELRNRWRKAEPIIFEDLVEEYRLDPFEDLTMGMAGVMEIEKRKEIRQKIKAAGGQTPQTFKLDGSFTHLLCDNVTYSETLQIVQKYLKKAERYIRRGSEIPDDVSDASTMRAAIKLKLVWIDWLEDSLAVEGCIEEEVYSINRPRPTAAQRAQVVQSFQSKKLETAQRIAASMKKSKVALSDPHANLKKLKAQEHNIPRPATKKPNVALNRLMEQIGQSSTGSTILKESTPLDDRISNGVEKAPEETSYESDSVRAPEEEEKSGNGKPIRSVDGVDPFSKNESLDESTDQAEDSVKPSKSDKKEEKKESETEEKEEVEKERVEEDSPDEEQLEIDESAGLLPTTQGEKGLEQTWVRIDLRDEVKNTKIFDALKKQGFTKLLKAEDPQKADFHVLPLAKVEVDRSSHLGKPVTHFFIERCLMEGRIIRMDEAFVLQPATNDFPIPESNLVHVATTGLGTNEDGPDRHQIEMALDVAGIKTSSIFKRGVHTHLLVGKKAEGSSSSDAKISRAKRWGVPIVGIEFVENVYRKGIISPPPSISANAPLSRDQSKSDLMDTSVSSTTLRETQANDSTAVLRSQNINNGNGQEKATNENDENSTKKKQTQSPKMMKRPWQRIVSSNVQSTTDDLTNGLIKENGRKSEPPLESQEKKKQDREYLSSLDIETQVIRNSSNQMIELLNGHMLERSTSTGQSSNRRRLPASIRDRIRMKSKTPNSEDCTDNGKDEECDISIVEEMLTRRREEEESGSMRMNNEAQSSLNPFAFNEEMEESMKVVYDDPVARRERRKMAAMINNSKRNAESRENDDIGNEKGPAKHITNAQSPASKRARTSITGFSPTMKARRQPGTANRDS